MNGAHFHLLVNHIPVFAAAFGLIALLWALLRKSQEMNLAAMFLFILSGVAGWIAGESGDKAEKIVEDLPGITHQLIHHHEEAADLAGIFLWILAAGAILVLLSIWMRKTNFVKPLQMLLVLIAIIANILVARAANFGGEIRHDEIRTQQSP